MFKYIPTFAISYNVGIFTRSNSLKFVFKVDKKLSSFTSRTEEYIKFVTGKENREYIDRKAQYLMNQLFKGDRNSLSRCITLIESIHPTKRAVGQFILYEAMKRLEADRLYYKKPALRIGFSGPPGAGKSTFIEGFGQYVTSKGMRMAVLTIDPSSVISGGSLLGDKTRMSKLACNPMAYIRSSPSSGTLGGIARRTSESVMLCEAAGYDLLVVETVGVGQAEVAVSDMVDMLFLLIPPGSGDELQGLKKGIVELADVILVTKSDGDLMIPSRHAKAEYLSALKFTRRRATSWKPQVFCVSARSGMGFEETWNVMQNFRNVMLDADEFFAKRKSQRKTWMWNNVRDNVMELFLAHPEVKHRVQHLEDAVYTGSITPGFAADSLLAAYVKSVLS